MTIPRLLNKRALLEVRILDENGEALASDVIDLGAVEDILNDEVITASDESGDVQNER